MSYYYNNKNAFPDQSYNGRIIDLPKSTTEPSKDYMSVPLDPEFDWDLSGSGDSKPSLTSTIHPFHKRKNRMYGQFQHTVKPMLAIRTGRRTFLFLLANFFVIFLLFSWCSASNSLALRAYAYLSAFDIMSLITCLVSIWISARQTGRTEDGNIQLINYERLELLFVFASVVLSTLASVFILKESTARIASQPEVAIGRLIPAALFGFIFHTSKMLWVQNKAFQCVTEASSSSIIQEHVADMSHSLCSVVPMLGRILLPRVDPFFLASFVGASFLLITDLLIQIDAYYFADTVTAILIAIVTICTMWPIANCSARVLLNTTPPYVLGQLDKLLSEAQTLDGVLEIRNERFHTIALAPSKSHDNIHHSNGYGLIMAGSIHVRVRRDADEQMVLAHVTNRLAPLVSNLTVQIVKDDWSSSGNLAKSSISSTSPITPSGPSRVKPQSSTIIYGFNKPAAAVAPYQQTPPKQEPPKLPFAPAAASVSIPVEPKKDDFSFSPTPVATKSKPTFQGSAAGSNIERMYKAAGFTSPPKVGVQGRSYANMASRGSFDKLPQSMTAKPATGAIN
uniref:Zinc transporter 6 n=1 Tax=Phallusia mammillata TaxID=59560 RepID=A0A6F9DSW5_9ASCI|nr:zinc transporter 6 [Phallusia mammillata]